MTELDPAKIMADHGPWSEDAEDVDYWCAECGAWPCLPYRLAEALAMAQRREFGALEWLTDPPPEGLALAVQGAIDALDGHRGEAT